VTVEEQNFATNFFFRQNFNLSFLSLQRVQLVNVPLEPLEDVQQVQGPEPAHRGLHRRRRRGVKVIPDVDVGVGAAALERH